MNEYLVFGRCRLPAAFCIAVVCCITGLSGCQKAASVAEPPPAADAKDKNPGAEETGEGVSLKPEEIQKMGIVTAAVAAVQHTPETMGFGVVVAHETVAQAVADFATAAAVEHQSRAALARVQRLAGTPGAMPAESQENAQRQAVVDEAALELTKRRLSSTFGQNPPWKNNYDSRELAALASGIDKLVRVTFPLGALGDAAPAGLRLAPINAMQGGRRWRTAVLWRAPADANVPGTSFFALLKASDASEGERLIAWAPVGDADSGVEVPAAAAVISAGKYWCYVEEKPGVFVRTEIDAGMPTDAGYFVKEGISAGDKVVTAAAGQLLARETNPSTAAE